MSPAAQVASATPQYALERTPRKSERLRAQARVRQSATERVLDRIELPPGARCLDASCGPGETMRLLARRVGACFRSPTTPPSGH